jgi:hypothetical protein
MIEVYVVVTLFAIGYLMNKNAPQKVSQQQTQKVNTKMMPSMNNVYSSGYTGYADAVAQKRSHAMLTQSVQPSKTGVISKNFKLNEEDDGVHLLSGEVVSRKEFVHGNMVPYFGGKMTQNVDDKVITTKFENFTGDFSHYKKKQEVESFFDKAKDVSNPYGMQNMNDYYAERMVAPKARNNETPFDKIYVGPGLNKGYTAEPSGGFHQADYRACIMPKSVDELRVATKPKTTFEARQLDGMKAKLPGKVGRVDKNRTQTFYEKCPDMLFRTTGANLKEKLHPAIEDKETNRQETSKEYIGGAISQASKARMTDSFVRPSDRHVLDAFGVRNVTLERKGMGEKYDHGKSKIMVFKNERDLTTTRVHQGNVTSLIKAIIAPIQDLVRITKKEGAVDNPRHYGNVAPQFPDKPTVYDPNDVARTTIKETTIDGNVVSNLKGHEKLTVYDPNDVARTTIKETTIDGSVVSNLKGHEKLTVYDPNDVARTTIKETTIHEGTLTNLKGKEKLTVYDPNDIARTTIKETTIHDGMGNGTVTGATQLYVYDPEEVAKTTLRETLERMDYELNLKGGAYKGFVKDPEDVARTTMKELTEMLGRDGNIGVQERAGAYTADGYDAKNTAKQFLSDMDYYGGAGKDMGNGYQVEEYDVKNTQKQFLSDIEYFGQALAGTDKKQTSYDMMMNADIDATKESTLFRRKPTDQGPKVANGAECLNVKYREEKCAAMAERATSNPDRLPENISSLSDHTLTREKQLYAHIENERLDPSILKAFLANPYTQPLDSVA